MKTRKQSEAEIVDRIESFDLDDYADGTEMIEALFERKEKIRSLFGDANLCDLPAELANSSDKKT